MSEIFDRLVDEAWPAPYSEDLGGWRLRYADGVTKRANSVLPLGLLGDLDGAIDVAERFYGDRDLPAVFSIGPGACRGLDDALRARGYDRVDPTLIMTADLSGGVAGPPVKIEDRPSAEWFDVWWTVDGRFLGGREPATRILTGVPADYVLHGLAAGRGVPQGEWYGIFCMAVLPEARRRGLAGQVLGALLERGRAAGARRAYLTVEEANVSARALYERAGFSIEAGYHYRVLR